MIFFAAWAGIIRVEHGLILFLLLILLLLLLFEVVVIDLLNSLFVLPLKYVVFYDVVVLLYKIHQLQTFLGVLLQHTSYCLFAYGC